MFCFGEDACFAERIVGRGALGRDGDLESERSLMLVVGLIDCREEAGTMICSYICPDRFSRAVSVMSRLISKGGAELSPFKG